MSTETTTPLARPTIIASALYETARANFEASASKGGTTVSDREAGEIGPDICGLSAGDMRSCGAVNKEFGWAPIYFLGGVY